MKLGFEEEQASFSSASQRARVWTETWVQRTLYCPRCGNSQLSKFPNNNPAADFYCTSCNEEFELKSTKGKFGARVNDGAYRTMRDRILSKRNPNFFMMRYSTLERGVADLFVVPKHFFSLDTLQPRKPLAETARRAGWTGCNILLGKIPEAGKIFLIREKLILPKKDVLARWQNTAFLRDVQPGTKGWLLDVMKCIEAIGKREFEIDDVYAFERQLQRLYPNNQNVKPKIRQQLQYLRDRGYLEFLSRGTYRLAQSS